MNTPDQIQTEIPREQIPTKVAELDQEYFKFIDLRVYTDEEYDTDEVDSATDLPITAIRRVIDVPATHAKIEAAQTRAQNRRDRKRGRPVQLHEGFNRANRRAFMKTLSKKERASFRRQAAEIEAKAAAQKEPEAKANLDKPDGPMV